MRLKVYSIVAGEPPLDWNAYRAGISLALRALPSPPVTQGRPGLGFLILHQTTWIDYLILAWWDRENELPLRVFVREHGDGKWRVAQGSESVCVWDLEVLWSEREAYVDTVLRADRTVGAEEYLTRHAGRPGDPVPEEVTAGG